MGGDAQQEAEQEGAQTSGQLPKHVCEAAGAAAVCGKKDIIFLILSRNFAGRRKRAIQKDASSKLPDDTNRLGKLH